MTQAARRSARTGVAVDLPLADAAGPEPGNPVDIAARSAATAARAADRAERAASASSGSSGRSAPSAT
jgi:hypothetical protein